MTKPERMTKDEIRRRAPQRLFQRRGAEGQKRAAEKKKEALLPRFFFLQLLPFLCGPSFPLRLCVKKRAATATSSFVIRHSCFVIVLLLAAFALRAATDDEVAARKTVLDLATAFSNDGFKLRDGNFT